MISLDLVTSELLCLTLLHSLWQMALLALTACGIGHFLGRRRDNVSYSVHTAALILGMLALPLTYVMLSLSSPEQSTESSPLANVITRRMSEPKFDLQAQPSLMPRVDTSQTLLPAELPIGNLSPTASARYGLSWKSAIPWFSSVYLIGVAIMLVRLLKSAISLEHLRATSKPIVEGPVFDSFVMLCRHWSLKAKPVLAHAEQVCVPKVVGLLKPTILLPSSALTGLSIEELQLILAHELSHVRRYDLWVNLLQRLSEAVLFFNPPMWWLSRRVSTLREYCCDDNACSITPDEIEPKLKYAKALLHAVELPSKDKTDPATALAASGRSPSELRRRVARLFGEPLYEPIRLSRGGVAVLLAGALLLLVPPTIADSSATDRQDSKAEVETQNDTKQETASVDAGVASISGKILLKDGSPAKAKGWLDSKSSLKKSEHSTSSVISTEGPYTDSFRFEVPAGTVWLSYFAEGYAPTWAGPFELKPGQELDDITLTLEPGFSEKLILQDEDGSRVPNAIVRAHPVAEGVNSSPVIDLKTDERGELLLQHLANTKYKLSITASGYQPLPTQPLRVEVGETLRPNMVRSQPATGIIRFADGTPAPLTKIRSTTEIQNNGHMLGLENDGEGFWGKVLIETNTKGRFRLDQLSDESQYLFVIEAVDGARAIVDSIKAGKQDTQFVLPRRHDFVIKVKGDLGKLKTRRGKPFIGVRQPVKIIQPDGSTYSDLIGADVTLEPIEGGGRAIFRGLAIDLREDAPKQTVSVTLGYDRKTKKTVDINRDGTTVVQFDLSEADDSSLLEKTDKAKTNRTDADRTVAEARKRTFGLHDVERIAFKQIYRQVDVPQMHSHPDCNLESLWKARDKQITDAEFNPIRNESILAWKDASYCWNRLQTIRLVSPGDNSITGMGKKVGLVVLA